MSPCVYTELLHTEREREGRGGGGKGRFIGEASQVVTPSVSLSGTQGPENNTVGGGNSSQPTTPSG